MCAFGETGFGVSGRYLRRPSDHAAPSFPQQKIAPIRERFFVCRKNLGEDGPEHHCTAPDAAGGYRFSKAMRNPGFIGVGDIRDIYLPMGFSQFKIEGRGLGSALILEFLLYYMTKPEYHLPVREAIYLDNMLDLF